MKKFCTSLFFGLFLSAFSFAQSNCDGFLPFEKGLKFEQTHYDAKGKVTTVADAMIEDIQPIEGGYEARVAMSQVDGKGKEAGSGSYNIQCIDGVLKMDLNSLMNPAMTEAYQSMEMTITGDGLQFPPSLSVGQELPAGATTIEVASNGLTVVTMSFESKDRKVETKEKITTAAGSFDCYKIRETITYQAMFLTRSYTTVGWYAKGVGLVKQETYDQKEKLSSWMELTRWGK